VALVGVVQRRTHLNCRRMQSASKLIVIIIVSGRCLVAAALKVAQVDFYRATMDWVVCFSSPGSCAFLKSEIFH